MELNTEKIDQLRIVFGYTWQDIADKGGLKSRQHAWEKFKRRSIKSADFFAKIFNMNPKDLIK
jgi:hypothetical protein